MNRNLFIVAAAFRVVGAILALCGLVVAVYFSIPLLQIGAPPAPHGGPPLEIGKYGVLALIDDGARAMAYMFFGLGTIVTWLFEIVAVIAFVVLLIGLVLYVVGRGFVRHATWARVVGVLLMIGLAIVSFFALTSLRHEIAPFALVPMAFSFYTLWVLIRRFA